METMSVTKALRELKTLDARIEKKINESTFVTAKKPKENIRGHKDVKSFEDDAKEVLQSIQDLITRRKKIKKALVESNASTITEVATVKMTVADAIERKNFLSIEKSFVRKLHSDFSKAQAKAEKDNETAQSRLDTQLNNMVSKETKTDNSAVDGYKKLFWDAEESKLIDPVDAKKLADDLERDIESFEGDVDDALNEINARTTITID